MKKFSGIWEVDGDQFDIELERRVLGLGSLDPQFGDPGLACAFVGGDIMLFPGTDFVFHDIDLDGDLSEFHEEEIEDGYWCESSPAVREFEYKIDGGRFLLRRLKQADAPWRLMPFRYEGENSFLIKPLGYYHRMQPTTIERMTSECNEFGLALEDWLREHGIEPATIEGQHSIADGLVDSPDDAVGFDPTSHPDEDTAT